MSKSAYLLLALLPIIFAAGMIRKIDDPTPRFAPTYNVSDCEYNIIYHINGTKPRWLLKSRYNSSVAR